MNSPKITAFLFLALASIARADLDFTPTVTRYFNEGAEYSNVKFKNDKKTVLITLPRLWECRGNASKLQLLPPDQKFAEGTLEAVPTKSPLRFDEATIKTLEQQALATLPPGSQGAAIVSQQENPVILEQNLSYEFVATYQLLGETFQRSLIYVSCPDTTLVFRFTAPKKAFDVLNRSFRQSLYSWQSTAPTAETAAAFASK